MIDQVRHKAKQAETALTAHLNAIQNGHICNDPVKTARLRAELVCRKSDLNFWENIRTRGAFALPGGDKIQAECAAAI